ncbi:MAG: NADH-quinone oxidoreductase subunit J, partial [Planctomycetes bacterium]|nr:NADH-quinone oxidoreductase subunit J [Planctomycetota bacterium]
MSELIYQVIFYAFAALVVGSAFIVAFSRNIVYSAFALLLTFFGVAGLYVFLAAEFLAAAQVLIYVGGILVLILFAVMLTNKITDVKLSNPATSPWIAAPLALVIFAGLLYV